MWRNQGIQGRCALWERVRYTVLLGSGVVLIVFANPCDAVAAAKDVPAPIIETVDGALISWAEFASTGDMNAVEVGFAPDGPQWRQLLEESRGGVSAHGMEPLGFTVRELRLRHLTTESATVWAQVEATRPEFQSQLFSWDFDLVRRQGAWQVWTVVEAEAPPVARGSDLSDGATLASPTTTTSEATQTEPTAPETITAAIAPADTSNRAGVRLPVLSAWIIVVTIVGVALAGYLAPRLEGRREP